MNNDIDMSSLVASIDDIDTSIGSDVSQAASDRNNSLNASIRADDLTDMIAENIEANISIVSVEDKLPELEIASVELTATVATVETITMANSKKDPIEAKAIEVNIRKLPALPVPYDEEFRSGRGLQVQKHLSLAKRTETFQAVCSYTGIVVEMTIPKIDGLVLEYVNPLSYWDNVRGIIEQGEGYLQKLDLQILAGLWITAYRHYELIDRCTDRNNSSILNAMVRTATKQVLIDSLLMAGHLTPRLAKRCARFDISYDAHKEAPNLMATINEYTRTVRDSVYPPEALKISKEEADIDAEWEAKANIKTSKKYSHKVTTVQEQFDAKFISDRKEAKILLKEVEELLILPTAFVSILKTVFQDRNLTSIAPELRAKMVTKLMTYQNKNCQRLAKIIEDGQNPYDLFADIATSLDRASDTFDSVVPQTTRKLSLKEILAAKIAAKVRKNQEDDNSNNGSSNSGSEF